MFSAYNPNPYSAYEAAKSARFIERPVGAANPTRVKPHIFRRCGFWFVEAGESPIKTKRAVEWLESRKARLTGGRL